MGSASSKRPGNIKRSSFHERQLASNYDDRFRFQLPRSHDEPIRELKFVYTILDKEIAQVAKEIMQEISIDEMYPDVLLREEINGINEIICLILFEKATYGFSRSEDILQGHREKHSEVKTIIVVCICKEMKKDLPNFCPGNSPYSKDPDIVLTYHINADGSPHGCSTKVVMKLQSHMNRIAIGEVKRLHTENMRLNKEVKLKEQTEKSLEIQLASALNDWALEEKEKKKLQEKLDRRVARSMENSSYYSSSNVSDSSNESVTSEDDEKKKPVDNYDKIVAENTKLKAEMKQLQEAKLAVEKKLKKKNKKLKLTVKSLEEKLKQMKQTYQLRPAVQQTLPKLDETQSTTLRDTPEETVPKRRKKKHTLRKRHGGELANAEFKGRDENVLAETYLHLIQPGVTKQGVK